MPAGTPVTQVAAGGAHTLALTSGGLVFGWGSDVFGQLATPLVLTQPVDSDVPVQPSGLPRSTPYVSIAAGEDSSYALTSDGVPWAWGGDYYGQLGDGSPGLNGIVPAPMSTLPPGTLATGLFAGPDSSAAFLVTRAEQTVTFPPITAPTYGDPAVDALPTATSGLGVTGAESGSCTGALAHLLLVGTGPCTVTATQAGSFAYYPASATTTFTVAPAVLQVIPDPVTGTAGQPLPALSYHLTGFKDGDTTAVVSGHASCTTTAQSGSFRGTYPVTCSARHAVRGPLRVPGRPDGRAHPRRRVRRLRGGGEGRIDLDGRGPVAGVPRIDGRDAAGRTGRRGRLHAAPRRVLDGGLGRRHLLVRVRQVRRVHGRAPAQPPDRGHGRHAGRWRLLGGRLGRRDLRLR